MKDKLFIIDAYGFVFRAYHIQPALARSDGAPTGALYGFASMLIKFISDFNPKYLTCVFDAGGKNFRHELYPEYKGHRPEIDHDLKLQLPLTRKIAEHLGIKGLEIQGFEADDVIASLAQKFSKDLDVVIISSDKDLMQLINDKVCMYDPIKSKYIKDSEVFEKFGVAPDKVRDLLAIVGDSSDNIPGIKGIGPKTAAELLKEYETLENLLQNAELIKQQKRRELILSSKDIALLCQKLVSLKHDISLDVELESFRYICPAQEKIDSFLAEYEFTSLSKRMVKMANNHSHTKNHISPLNISPQASVISLETESQMLSIRIQAEHVGRVALLNQDNALYLHIEGQQEVYCATAPEIINDIINIISQPQIFIVTYKLKYLLHFLSKLGCSEKIQAEDVNLMQYLASGGISEISTLSDLTNSFLHTSYIEDHISVLSINHLYTHLLQVLVANNNYSVYKEIDLRLSYVLFQMEKTGIKVDTKILSNISAEIDSELKTLESKIFEISKEKFNIGSPKQLGEILFDKLNLPFAKSSGKAKNYSTSVDVLEKLSEAGFIIADYLIEWRTISKIQNTYADALPKQIDQITKRIHTEFSQTSTLTGRLSSINPNLQNIPIRSKLGNRIRESFVSENGFSLISADYSQIELRVLASIANIQALKEAFSSGLDIHTQTACKIFRLHEKDLTPEHRRKAKAINFGIIYGISAFGLAKQLGINPMEAKEYINGYFNQYHGIYEYMERVKGFARKNHYVQNLFGRKCFIKGINDSNANIKNFSERSAINAPIQSTAADIAKIAMIKLENALTKGGFQTKMLLQVHDEIVFEAPDSEVQTVSKIIKEVMESAVDLAVPLIVDTNVSKNWKK